MSIRTRWRLAAAGVTVCLLTVACTEADGDPAADGGDPAAGDDADEGGDGSTISFAHSYGTSHPHHECGAQLVAEGIAEADVGLEVDVFPNSQLGGDSDRFDSVMSGDIDIDLQGASALAAAHSPIGLFDTAYAFDDADHLFGFFDEEADELRAEFEEATGTKVLDVWYFGMRHFTSNEPIQTPEDLSGMRMRFPDSPVYLANAEALGADATAVAFEEIFLSLQQGVIDGQENSIPSIAEMSLDEVQDYVNLSGHQTGAQLTIVAESTWEALSEEQQEALEAAFEDVREENRDCVETQEQEFLDEWADSGALEVVDDVDVDAFRERSEQWFLDNLEGRELELYEQARDSA